MRISALVLVMISVALLLMWLLNALVQRTTLGRCMRAVAEDREVAAVMGVNVRRVISLTFLLGSALGGAAGVLVGPVLHADRLLHGLLGRTESVHRGGARRHRQSQGRDARAAWCSA